MAEPVAVTVTVVRVQLSGPVLAAVTEGADRSCCTVVLAVAVHPLAPVTVTEYNPATLVAKLAALVFTFQR